MVWRATCVPAGLSFHTPVMLIVELNNDCGQRCLDVFQFAYYDCFPNLGILKKIILNYDYRKVAKIRMHMINWKIYRN